MATDAEPPDQSGAPTVPRVGDRARSLARKPVVWLTGVVVAALGVTLTNAIVPTFNSLLDPILQRGPAVRVVDASTFRSEPVSPWSSRGPPPSPTPTSPS